MKTKHHFAIFALTAGLATAMPMPVMADTIFPNLYAKTESKLRSIGANTNNTIIATISESKARVKTWAMVKCLKGTYEQSDIVLAAVEAIRR